MNDRFEQGQWEESFSRKKGRERHKRRENQSPMPSPTKGNRLAQRQHVDTADGIGSTKSVILALLAASQQQQQQPLAICARDSDAAGSVEALRVQLAAKDKQIAALEATLAERRDHQARLEETNAEMRAQINSLTQAKITQQQMAEQTRMPSPYPPPPVVTCPVESSAAFKALTDLVARS